MRLLVAAQLLAAVALHVSCASRPPPAPPARVPSPVPAPPEPGSIRGRALQPLPQQGAPGGSPLVVFATRLDGPDSPRSAPRATAIRRRDGAYRPAFAVVATGDVVRFVNEDEIYHRVFSSSEGNEFDLGVLGKGESSSVVFSEPGVVRFYCSLHESERGVVFAAPGPHYAVVAPDGTFELAGLAPGRYELRTASDAHPESRMSVTVQAGRATAVEIPTSKAGPVE